jgi:hypothetical protein
VDLALDQFIRTERVRADMAAYRRVPPVQEQIYPALLADSAALTNDTDWEGRYADDANPLE